MVSVLNSDLADTLGNLVQRVTARKLHAALREDRSLTWLGCDTGPVSNTEDSSLLERLRNISGTIVSASDS